MNCPCLSGLPYAECCKPVILGRADAPTAERLMRSRYSAYATGHADHLLSTWHPSTRPAELALDPDVRWYRLDILSRTRGGLLDTTGTLEFRASFRSDAGAGSQHQNSRFVKVGGAWFYVDEVG